jgi:hypothetical protein
LARELGVIQDEVPVELFVDNSGALELSRDRRSCHRSRHVDRRYFKVRELSYHGVLRVEKVDTADNASDVLTKVLDYASHWKHVSRLMNLRAIPDAITSAAASKKVRFSPVRKVPRSEYDAACARQAAGTAWAGDEVTLSHAASRGVT